MGGGGGTSGAIDFPDYIEDVHKAWLNNTGADTLAGVSLTDIMLNALTTGNPFSGFAYTNPTADLMEAQARYHSLDALVGALDETVDWPNLVAAILGKVDALNTLKDLTTDTLMDAARTEADDEIDAAVLKKDSGIDQVTDWQAMNTAAKAAQDPIGAWTGVDPAAEIASGHADADAQFDAAVLKKASGINHVTDWQTMYDTVKAKMDAIGAISSVDAPGALGFGITDANASFDAAVLKKATGLNQITDWEAMFDAAKAKLDAIGNLTLIDTDAILTAALTTANAQIDAAILKRSSGINQVVDWQAMFDAAVARADVAGNLKPVDVAAITSAAITAAGTMLTAAKAEMDSGLNEQTDFQALVDIAVAKLAEVGVLTPVDIDTLITDAVTAATAAITDTVSAVESMLNTGALQAIVDGYEQRISLQRAQRINSFSSPMADIGAVHSSAFLIGLALIEQQHQSDVNRFASELTLQTHNTLMGIHSNSVSAFLQASAQLGLGNMEARANLLRQGVQNMVDMLVNRTQFERALIDVYNSGFQARLNAGVQGAITEKNNRDQLIMNSTQAMQQIQQVKASYEQQLIGAYNDIANVASQLRVQAAQVNLQTTLQERVSRDQLVEGLTRSMVEILTARVQYEQQLMQLHSQLNLQSADMRLRGSVTDVETVVNERANRDQVLASLMGGIVDVLRTKASYEQQMIGVHSDLSKANAQLRVATKQADNQLTVQERLGRDQVVNDAVRSMAGILDMKAQYERHMISLHRELFSEALDTQLRAAVVNKANRDQLLSQGIEHAVRMQALRLEMHRSATGLLTEIKRIKVVATGEYEAAEVDLDEKFALWDFGVFERGANILAAPSGMAAALPTRPSRAASALGGALGGAGAGATTGSAIGAAGGPVTAAGGAAIGAVLGGIAGLLG